MTNLKKEPTNQNGANNQFPDDESEDLQANDLADPQTTPKDEVKKLDPKIMWVKKSLKDPTAALSYSLSVSILHLAMVVGLVLVERPNVEAARKINKYCEQEAVALEEVLGA